MINQNRIWDYYQTRLPDAFAGAGHRLRHLAHLVPSGSRVMTIGVGDGLLEGLLSELDHEVVSLDPSAASLSKALRHTTPAAAGSIDALPFKDASFDAVIASEVLEHLDPDKLVASVAEVARVLRPTGLFIGSVPHAEDLTRAIVCCPGCSLTFHRYGHESSFDFESMRQLLATSFGNISLSCEPFMNSADFSWRKMALSKIRRAFVRAGLLTRDVTLVFNAQKTA